MILYLAHSVKYVIYKKCTGNYLWKESVYDYDTNFIAKGGEKGFGIINYTYKKTTNGGF